MSPAFAMRLSQVALFPTKNDLIPAERAQLGDAQPVAIGDPDR